MSNQETESSMNMETSNDKDIDATESKKMYLFNKKKDKLALLQALFKHGYPDYSIDIFPDLPEKDQDSCLVKVLKYTKTLFKDKPSIIDFIRSGMFQENDCNVPLVLLLIALYERPCNEENAECDFKEIYRFLYKMTTNQPALLLSPNSGKVLYKLLKEITANVWPDIQQDLFKYLSKVHKYNRPINRKTYSGKRILQKKRVTKS